MKKFKFEVSDGFFPQVFEGEIESESREKAMQELAEDYAVALDTMPEDIQVSLFEIN